jgi:hypothetical protein
MSKKLIISIIIISICCLLYCGYIFTVLTKHNNKNVNNPSPPYQQSQESQVQESKDDQDTNESNLPSGWKIQFDKTHEKYRWCDDEGYCNNMTDYESKEEAIAAAWQFKHDHEEEEKSVWVDDKDE